MPASMNCERLILKSMLQSMAWTTEYKLPTNSGGANYKMIFDIFLFLKHGEVRIL